MDENKIEYVGTSSITELVSTYNEKEEKWNIYGYQKFGRLPKDGTWEVYEQEFNASFPKLEEAMLSIYVQMDEVAKRSNELVYTPVEL